MDLDIAVNLYMESQQHTSAPSQSIAPPSFTPAGAADEPEWDTDDSFAVHGVRAPIAASNAVLLDDEDISEMYGTSRGDATRRAGSHRASRSSGRRATSSHGLFCVARRER